MTSDANSSAAAPQSTMVPITRVGAPLPPRGRLPASQPTAAVGPLLFRAFISSRRKRAARPPCRGGGGRAESVGGTP